jgi:hypothetical protein
VNLNKGENKLRLLVEQGDFDLDSIQFDFDLDSIQFDAAK